MGARLLGSFAAGSQLEGPRIQRALLDEGTVARHVRQQVGPDVALLVNRSVAE